MQMVSYWKRTESIYEDDGLVLIIGWYDHKNQESGGHKALGVHWRDFPKSHNVLSPCVIPERTRNSILSGLLHDAVIAGDRQRIQSLMKGIEFFRDRV